MLSKTIRTLLGFLLILVVSSPSLVAKNSQTFVIGFGIGTYTYEDDDLEDADDIYYGSEFLEWYLFDEVGLGLRTHKFYKTGSSDSGEEFLMANLNLTVNWVFMGSTEALRATIYAGYGPGGVSYSNEKTNIDITESATTSSMGLFIDWGGSTIRFPIIVDQLLVDICWEKADSYSMVKKKELIGFAQIFERFGYSHLGRVAINPDLRGQKSGIELVKLVLDATKSANRDYSLFVYEDNIVAKQMYKKLGFQDQNYPEGQKAKAGSLFMVKKINPSANRSFSSG